MQSFVPLSSPPPPLAHLYNNGILRLILRSYLCKLRPRGNAMFTRISAMLTSLLLFALAFSCTTQDAPPQAAPGTSPKAALPAGVRCDFESLNALPADWSA